MKIEIINPINFPTWNQQIAELKGATIFHSSNWAQVLHDSYRYIPRYFCTIENDRITNLIPVMEINSPFTGKRGVCLPFSDKVEPLVEGQDLFRKILESIIAFGTKRRWRTLIFHGGDDFLGNESSFTHYISSFIELNGRPNNLFKDLKSSTQRNIKKAQKSSLKTEIVQSIEGIDAFYKLNCLSRKGHGLPPQPFFFFEKIFYNVIVKNRGFICLTSLNDQPIAGVVFFHFNRYAMYKYGASDKNFLQFRPNDLSMFKAIEWCVDHNIRYLDLGRTDPYQHGLLQFKKKWNSVEKYLRYYKYDFKEHFFVKDKFRLRNSYSVFKKIPLPLLKVIGRFFYSHFA